MGGCRRWVLVQYFIDNPVSSALVSIDISHSFYTDPCNNSVVCVEKNEKKNSEVLFNEHCGHRCSLFGDMFQILSTTSTLQCGIQHHPWQSHMHILHHKYVEYYWKSHIYLFKAPWRMFVWYMSNITMTRSCPVIGISMYICNCFPVKRPQSKPDTSCLKYPPNFEFVANKPGMACSCYTGLGVTK